MIDPRITEALARPDDEAIPRLQALAAEGLAGQAFPLRAHALVAAGQRLLATDRAEDAAHAAIRAIALFDALQGGAPEPLPLFALAVRALEAMEQPDRADEARTRGATIARALLAAAPPDERLRLEADPDLRLLLGPPPT